MLAFCMSFNFVSQWHLVSVLCLQSWKNGGLLSCGNISLFILRHTLFSTTKCSSRMQYNVPSFGGRKQNEEKNGFITTLRTHGFKPHFFFPVSTGEIFLPQQKRISRSEQWLLRPLHLPRMKFCCKFRCNLICFPGSKHPHYVCDVKCSSRLIPASDPHAPFRILNPLDT